MGDIIVGETVDIRISELEGNLGIIQSGRPFSTIDEESEAQRGYVT